MRVTFSGTMSSTALITHPSTRSRSRTWALPCPPTPTNPIRTGSIGGAAKKRSGAGPAWSRGWADAARTVGAQDAVPLRAARPSPPAISFKASRRSKSSLFAVMSTSPSQGPLNPSEPVTTARQHLASGQVHRVDPRGGAMVGGVCLDDTEAEKVTDGGRAAHEQALVAGAQAIVVGLDARPEVRLGRRDQVALVGERPRPFGLRVPDALRSREPPRRV